VDDAVRRRRTRPQTIEVIDIPAMHLGAVCRDGRGRPLRPRQTDHAVARPAQFFRDR
jgi:hypothetical protein